MIIFDFNTFCIATAFSIFKEMPDEFSAPVVRHAALKSIVTLKLKHQKRFGKEIVIAGEGKGQNWRKEIFPYYKIKRKESRNNFPIPWEDVATVIDNTFRDIKENFPWKAINHDRAEADDVIAAITKHCVQVGKEVLIVSSDKDFGQLQIFPGVHQFSPYMDNFLIDNDPYTNRLKKIITGDSGDSVPNIISDADVFADKAKRQKPMTAQRMQVMLEHAEENNFPEELKETFLRNKSLVDLVEGIPKRIENDIVEAYVNYTPVSGKLYNYFAGHGMFHHMENIQDFT